MSDRVTEYTPDGMPDRISECISDRMPEDVRQEVRKSAR